MDIKTFPSYYEQSAAIAGEILALLKAKPDALFCLAAGHTSQGVFDALIRAAVEGADFSRARFIGLDEWSGLGGGDDGSCRTFMDSRLFQPLGLREEQIVFFDGRAVDMDAECRRMKAFLDAEGPIDYLLLGMGQNGHLALNEPGAAFGAGVRAVMLDSVTKAVGQKYFQKETRLEGGVTLGFVEIAQALQTVLMVSGAHKRDILRCLMLSEPDEALPASFLKTLPHARLYVDEAALG